MPYFYRNFFLVSCYFLAWTGAFAQSSDFSREHTELYIVPTSIFNWNPRIRLGGEYFYRSNRSLALDIGYGNGAIDHEATVKFGPDNYRTYTFLEVKPAFKIFSNGATGAWYTGIEPFFISKHYGLKENWRYDLESGDCISYRQSDYYEKRLGVHLLGGRKFDLFNIFRADLFLGIGGAYKFSEFKNDQLNENQDFIDVCQDLQRHPEPNLPEVFNKMVWHPTLGLKLGVPFYPK